LDINHRLDINQGLAAHLKPLEPGAHYLKERGGAAQGARTRAAEQPWTPMAAVGGGRASISRPAVDRPAGGGGGGGGRGSTAALPVGGNNWDPRDAREARVSPAGGRAGGGGAEGAGGGGGDGEAFGALGALPPLGGAFETGVVLRARKSTQNVLRLAGATAGGGGGGSSDGGGGGGNGGIIPTVDPRLASAVWFQQEGVDSERGDDGDGDGDGGGGGGGEGAGAAPPSDANKQL
jgi:hypothetical protein